MLLDEARGAGERDLVYCNGVFHHIAPGERGEWAARVLEILVPGGFFALWENNPWNPGTRNRGYGAAIKEGFSKGKGDLVAFLDADGTCDPALLRQAVLGDAG